MWTVDGGGWIGRERQTTLPTQFTGSTELEGNGGRWEGRKREQQCSREMCGE